MTTHKIINFEETLKCKQLLNKTIEPSTKLSHNMGKEADPMTNYIERKEFEQFEKRIDDNLSNINSKLDKLPDQIETKINLSAEKMKNSQMKWFIGIIVSILGLAGRIFGIY